MLVYYEFINKQFLEVLEIVLFFLIMRINIFMLIVLFIIFLVLKLTETVAWSWWIITLPLWIIPVILFVFFILWLIAIGFCVLISFICGL